MKKGFGIFFCFCFFISSLNAQSIDTLSIKSKHFGDDRAVYVVKPELYKYMADDVELPVIFVLDGQHEWFLEPVLNNIEFLQYTHEVPQALVVVIPHKNRNTECGISEFDGDPLPLHLFITQELPAALSDYKMGNTRIIIGHSFSASFSLYSYGRSPEFYSGVFAHSPLDKLEKIIQHLKNTQIQPEKIYLSVGGYHQSKDFYHRRKYEEIKEKYPKIFERLNLFEANHATHNAVPIVANPDFLTTFFHPFAIRFSKVAKVDDSYQLVSKPGSVQEEMDLLKAIQDDGFDIPLEIADINGIASRYWAGNYEGHVKAIYEKGAALYPHYSDFHFSLGQLAMSKDPKAALNHFQKSKELLIKLEQDNPDYPILLEEINAMTSEVEKALKQKN